LSTRRLRSELLVWRGVWQQLVTFLDRIDGCADMDKPQVQVLSALLPVAGVIERAYARAVGFGLGAALACAPRGDGMPARSLGELQAVAARLPGAEDQEFAAATLKPKDDGTLDDDAPALLWGTATLFTFRDEKHGDVQVICPAYDVGRLPGGLNPLSGVVAAGHFPRSVRDAAVNNGDDNQLAWTALRASRRAAQASAPGDKPKALSDTLAPLHLGDGFAALGVVGTGAVTAAADCRNDQQILAAADPVIRDAGVSSTVTDALGAARDALALQAADYQFAVDSLTSPGIGALNETTLATVKARLARADRPGGVGIAPALLTLDTEMGKALDDATATRLAYPDGTLRHLRLIESMLRWQWAFRERWFEARRRLALRPLYVGVMSVFCDSLTAVRDGDRTTAPLGGGVTVARDTPTQSMTIPIRPRRDLSKLVPGQIAIVRGARPTLALLLASEIKPAAPGQPSQQLLHVAPVNVSVASDPKLPGIAGLVQAGTTIDAEAVTVSADELLAGASDAGANADALPQEVAALGSRLALILGAAGGPGRPAPPAIPAPYQAVASFDVEEPVSVGDTRLFLKAVPPVAQAGTSRAVMMARPGELLLIRGAAADDTWWQSVIEVGRVDILTGAAARAQDQATGTPTPACCGDDTPVVVITVRDMQLPHDLVRGVSLSRGFQGFGCASVAARQMLPETLDPETATVHINDGGTSRVLRRDPELDAVVHILDGWLGGEQAAQQS
jgi:hypothetical protein